VHWARPFPEYLAGHGQHVERGTNETQPLLDLKCFGCILFARELNAGLDLADRDAGDVQFNVCPLLEPGEDAARGLGLAQLGCNVGVHQIHDDYLKAAGGRRRAFPLAGKTRSARALCDRSSSLSEGCAAACKRRHS
jgi:hypothetical protein